MLSVKLARSSTCLTQLEFFFTEVYLLLVTPKMQVLMACPVCGQEVDSETLHKLGLEGDVLHEVRTLRDEGKLKQAIFLAIKVVRTVEGNPQWKKDLLEEQTRILSLGFKDAVYGSSGEVLKALHELTGSPLRGKIQEVSIAKRLKTIVPTDSFTTENSTRKGEDVECSVIEESNLAGTIIVESKRVKTWSSAHIDQVKEYMAKRGTPFGIVATTAMPSDALSDSLLLDGVLVVKVDHVDVAYLFMRQYLIAKLKLEREYQSRVSQLQVSEQVIQDLRDSINNGELDEIISSVPRDADAIDDMINNAIEYIRTLSSKVKKKTDHIRAMTTKLMSNHIGVIRAKLAGDTDSTGSSASFQPSGSTLNSAKDYPFLEIEKHKISKENL